MAVMLYMEGTGGRKHADYWQHREAWFPCLSGEERMTLSDTSRGKIYTMTFFWKLTRGLTKRGCAQVGESWHPRQAREAGAASLSLLIAALPHPHTRLPPSATRPGPRHTHPRTNTATQRSLTCILLSDSIQLMFNTYHGNL